MVARGGGVEVRNSSGLWPDWAAAAGSSKAKCHETNPRARQDKTMIRIELERRKFFSRGNVLNASPDASGLPIAVLVTCGQDRGEGLSPPSSRKLSHAQTISLYMISLCHVSDSTDCQQHLSYEGISRGQFPWDGERFALGEVAVMSYRQTTCGVTKFVASLSRNVNAPLSERKAQEREAPLTL